MTFALAGVLLATAGCGGGDDQGQSEDLAQPAESAQSELFGIYERSLDNQDLAREGVVRGACPGCKPPPTGRWEMTIDETEVFVFAPDGYSEFGALDSISEGKLVFPAPRSSDAGTTLWEICLNRDNEPLAGQGVYRWELDDDGVLRLAKVEDDCRDRAAIFSGEWRPA